MGTLGTRWTDFNRKLLSIEQGNESSSTALGSQFVSLTKLVTHGS